MEAARYIGVCEYVPAYRGESGRTGSLFRARVDEAFAPSELPADLPCEDLILYLSPYGGEADLRDVTCLLR